jgi:uncharacterized membrane protein
MELTELINPCLNDIAYNAPIARYNMIPITKLWDILSGPWDQYLNRASHTHSMMQMTITNNMVVVIWYKARKIDTMGCI